jgi:hypothetical protein
MSRYTKVIPEKGIEIAWGYDRPLASYFIEEFKLDTPEDEEEVVFSISSIMSTDPHPRTPNKFNYSNSEILTIMKEYEEYIPEDHLHAVALDIPY